MLQIYIHGPIQSGFLDIDPATSLDMESVADIFDEDFSAGEFSLPVDIPWTEHNRRLTGFAERFQNSNTKEKFFKCVVYDSGFPELTAAKISFTDKSGNFSYTKGKFSATITGTKGLFGSQVKNKYLTDLNLGGKITFFTDSRTFAESLMKGGFATYSTYLTFVPVAIENFFDTGRPDYDGEFLAKDTVNTVISNGAGPDGWVFGRPTSADATVAAAPGSVEYADYRTVPFIKTKYLLRKIFEENGYKVTGAFFDSPDYDDLVTFNNYAIENYSPTHFDFNRSIFPANHVPKILIVDYLKGLLPFFNMYPVFVGDNEVRLIFRKDLKTQKRILSLNGIVAEQFTSNNDAANNGDGYKLSYDWGNDDYNSDRVKELKDKTLVATVPTIQSLAGVNPGRQMTTDDIAFVEAENLYYQVADATATPVKWDAFAENLDEYISGAGERSVDISISTLCTYVELQSDTGLYVRRDYAGTRMSGSYINNKGVRVINKFSNKIFFARRRNNSSNVKTPMSYNHNRDAANNLINPFSLAWKTTTGMAAIFHQDWQSIKQNTETVKTSVIVNRKILSDLANNNFIEIKGCLFIMSKLEKTIPTKSVINIELVVV